MNYQLNEQFQAYESKKNALLIVSQQSPGEFILKKKTASNLFRYLQSSDESTSHKTEIVDFDQIISIDTEKGILEVEGMTPYEKIVEFTLQYGFLPTVAPELKHITIGGATVGIGIESSGHKYGFVHDGLLEADVLLPDGRIVTVRGDNEYADLFYALPNSYGTLGYILRAKIKIYPALPYVHIKTHRFSDPKLFLEKMMEAIYDIDVNFVEGLIFSKNEMYLMKSHFVPSVEQTDDIYRENIFYRLIRQKPDVYLTSYDYIFRYDPDWFWNIPETFFYNCFRKFAPKKWRNSGFYKKYVDGKKRWLRKLGVSANNQAQEEPLIQDWEVPWDKAQQLLAFALDNIDLGGKPWAVVPIKPVHQVTLYPMQPETFYFNLGCYCYSKTQQSSDPFYNTKLMDDFCFSLNGLKMLYSSTFLSEQKFSEIYNGAAYLQLKKKYDPENRFKSLYDKVTY